MEILADERRTGKTSKLLEECLDNHGIFIAYNRAEVSRLRSICNYPDIYTITDFIDRKMIAMQKPVYVDNLDIILVNIFGSDNIKASIYQERDFKYHIREAIKRKL